MTDGYTSHILTVSGRKFSQQSFIYVRLAGHIIISDKSVITPTGGMKMATYILLMNLTEKGLREIKGAPGRIEETVSAFEAMGGKMIGVYPVIGEYDYVVIGDLPEDTDALTFSLGVSSRGYVRIKTLKAFTTDAFAGVVNSLP
ncbi:MAG: GYD domain-containing protein [Methanomicrobiales archaeon]|nr:GYD domain-containing protein [Methanomicrobiales archaeon]